MKISQKRMNQLRAIIMVVCTDEHYIGGAQSITLYYGENPPAPWTAYTQYSREGRMEIEMYRRGRGRDYEVAQ